MPSWFYIIFVLAVGISLAIALREAFFGRRGAIFWRQVKFASTLASLFGIFTIVVSIDALTLDSFRSSADQYARDELSDLRFLVASYMFDHCPNGSINGEDPQTCSDFHNIDRVLNSSYALNHTKIKEIVNWQKNKALDKAISETNSYIQSINTSIDISSTNPQLFSSEFKTKILFLSAIPLALAMCGSIGEAAYQLRLASKGS